MTNLAVIPLASCPLLYTIENPCILTVSHYLTNLAVIPPASCPVLCTIENPCILRVTL